LAALARLGRTLRTDLNDFVKYLTKMLSQTQLAAYYLLTFAKLKDRRIQNQFAKWGSPNPGAFPHCFRSRNPSGSNALGRIDSLIELLRGKVSSDVIQIVTVANGVWSVSNAASLYGADTRLDHQSRFAGDMT